VKAGFRGLAALALLALAACTQTFDAVSLGVPATMAAPAGEAVAGKPFSVHAHTVHGLFGLVTLSQANIRKALAGQLVGGEGIAQLRIKTKSRWFDVLLTGLTAGLIIPRTVIYEGVVVGR
jgi:hypothetical protein